MAGLNIRRSVVAFAMLIVMSHAVIAQVPDVAEAQQFVSEVCPKPWEGYYTKLDLLPGADIWQSDLGDKARYIRFSSPGMTPSDSDNGGQLQIKLYTDQENISACSLMRQYFFDAVRQNAQVAAAFDHTTIRDEDADGVFNASDICDNTLAGESVDADGCSATQLASDADGDGVHDAIDQCPDTLPGGIADAQGCAPIQLDADLDGVPDSLDAYPFQHNSQCTD